MNPRFTPEQHLALADRLFEAEGSATPIPPITETHAGFGEEDAYEVQLVNAQRAVAAGRRLVGYKVGITSKAAQRHFKVEAPDFGHLFADMAVPEESELDARRLIQPKIEGEIAFVLGRDLVGPGISLGDAMRAVDYVAAAMEIVDSRIQDWKISAADTIADNGSSARYVLSARARRLAELDLPSVGMALSRNGEVMHTGAGSAVLGNPLAAVVFLANALGRHGRRLEAGQIVLSGSLSGMIPLVPGDAYRCEMSDLGDITVRVGGKEKR